MMALDVPKRTYQQHGVRVLLLRGSMGVGNYLGRDWPRPNERTNILL